MLLLDRCFKLPKTNPLGKKRLLKPDIYLPEGGTLIDIGEKLVSNFFSSSYLHLGNL